VSGLRRLRQSVRPTPAPDFSREVEPRGPEGTPATDRLYSRLGAGAQEAVAASLDEEQARAWSQAGARERRSLTLAFGVHLGLSEILEPTGLSGAAPPEDVHAMGRGALAAGGAYYYADLVASALAHAGGEPGDGTRGLDFGCSSGRVVRVLAAAWPHASWEGCDPNAGSVAWAREHLPGVEFFQSPQAPPLPRRDGAYELAFAISIWSHFAAQPALAWLAEMRRVLVPGGLLVLTTHGASSVAHAASRRPLWQLEEVMRALHRHGHWFTDEFGERGDWGVRDPGWGSAFMAPEWLLTHARADWSVEGFWPGGAEADQDLWVLRRR
jgi:SAM-dependent methyltransferase